MRNDCDRVLTTDKLKMCAEVNVDGHNHDKLVCSDHRDIGRPIKDAIKRGIEGDLVWETHRIP